MPSSTVSITNLNSDWVYHPGRFAGSMNRALNQKAAEPVVLPHSWNTKDTFQTDVPYRIGRGSYYRKISVEDPLDEETHQWILCSDGFFGLGSLRVNGKKILDFDAQYLGFEVDLTSFLSRTAELELCITVSNLPKSDVLPGIKDPDFLLYGGLASTLRLEKRPRVSIPLDSVHVFSTWEEGSPQLNISCEADNASASSWEGTVEWSLSKTATSDLCASTSENLKVASDTKVISQIVLDKLPDVEFWTLERPTLYQVTGRLMESGRCVHEVQIPFGFRQIEFDDQGFLRLNGKVVKIRGCNRHESLPGFGNALPDAVHVQDAALIKSMGFNAVRLSHYPQNKAFLNACDELGLLVYAEIASWKTVRTGTWLVAACRQLEAMIRRDRNHPSIILWGLGNESRSKKAFARMTEVVRELDPHRFTIYAENHLYRAKRKDTLNSVDVWGCNYELDLLEELKEHSRTGAVIVSECSNQPHARRGDFQEEMKQIEQFDRDLNRIDESGSSAGFFIWSFQDYATLRKKRYARYCGVVDAWRQPKMAADYLSVRWSDRLSVKAWPSFSDDGEETVLVIFTNGDEVEITQGSEKSLQSSDGLISRVPLMRRDVPVTVTARKDGVEEIVEILPLLSFGEAEQLTLESVSLDSGLHRIDVVIADESGAPVRNWEGRVPLRLKGAGRVFHYNEEGTVWISCGTGRVYLEHALDGEEWFVEAEFAGLKSVSLKIETTQSINEGA